MMLSSDAGSLHHRACALATLLKVTLFFLAVDYHALSPLDSFCSQLLLALSMPPSQLLLTPAVRLVCCDGPLAARYLDLNMVFWEVELWKEYLSWRIFSGRGRCVQRKSECAALQVKTMGNDVSVCCDRSRSYKSLPSPEARMITSCRGSLVRTHFINRHGLLKVVLRYRGVSIRSAFRIRW